jgi:hypothetical protein
MIMGKKTKMIFSMFIVLLFLIFVDGCKKFELDDPNGLDISDVISIDASPGELKANGVDMLKVVATLQGDTPDGQEVTFKTDSGKFASLPTSGTSNKNPQEIKIKTAGRVAEAYLISSTEVKTAILSASVGDFITYTTVEFIRVLPESIMLTSDRITLDADGKSTANLTAILRPPDNIGIVSENTIIIFKATDNETGSEAPLLYREEKSDSTGKCKTSLISNQTGVFKITCFAEEAETVFSSIIITFVD